MRSLPMWLLTGFLVIAAAQSQGAVVATITPSTTSLPSTGGTVSMTVNLAGDAGEALNIYDLYFDISNVDLNAGGAITLGNAQSLQAATLPIFSFLNPAGSGRDFAGTGASVGAAAPLAGGIDLFSFDATFAANTSGTPISYAFNFTPGVPGFALQINGAAFDVNTVTYNNTAVELSSVPEPSSLALLVAGAGLVGFRRRRS